MGVEIYELTELALTMLRECEDAVAKAKAKGTLPGGPEIERGPFIWATWLAGNNALIGILNTPSGEAFGSPVAGPTVIEEI